jgi:hypothetical protein
MGQAALKLKADAAAALIKNSHSEKTILVGGQAVSFWAAYSRIESDRPILTNDIDYLGHSSKSERRKAGNRRAWRSSSSLRF